MSESFEVVSLEERFDLFEQADELCTNAWPEFMRHDPVGNENWMTFIEAFKEYQLIIVDDNAIVAVINSIPLQFLGSVDELPQTGWDWGVLKAIEDLKNGKNPNVLFGVQIVVNPSFQGKGISSLAAIQMKILTKRFALGKLIIPVRPNMKCNYPLIEMDDYVNWKNSEGLCFDNWLRVHQKNGGRIVKVCDRAMKIEGTIRDWETWTGKYFPGSGQFIIEGALNPIQIDVENDSGIYIEPNVWVVYENSLTTASSRVACGSQLKQMLGALVTLVSVSLL